MRNPTLVAVVVIVLLSSSRATCVEAADYSAYAPPAGVWGPQVQVGAHVGEVTYTISAKPVGKTVIVGEVEYCKDADERTPTKREFTDSITIRTGKAYSTVKVRFKGIPLGTVVNVHVAP